MPVYEYECRTQHVTERIFKITDFPEEISCGVCSEKARKIISVPSKRDISGYPYMEENFGDFPIEVTSPEHRKKLMKERGLREYRSPRWKGHPGAWY